MRKCFAPSSVASLVCAVALLAGCAGHSASVVPNDATSGGDSRTASTPSRGNVAVKATVGKFVLRVPKPPGKRGRRPLYVSAATLSITAQVTDVKNGPTDITPNPAPALVTINIPNGGSSPGSPCVNDPLNAGDYDCTIALPVYVGSDTIAISSYSAANAGGSVLSQQNAVETVVANAANSFTITLDANAATMTVTGGGSCAVGPVGAALGSVGTTTATVSVSFTDPAGKTIVGPGLPLLSVAGNDAAYHTGSGTINGTGGTVAFTINQSAQTISLTPSTSSTTNATVTIKAVSANATGSPSDGLTFTLTKSFAFSTGNAPPAHNFIAFVEQMGTASGQIDLYNVALGGSGAPDTFTAFTPATLAVTNSSNEGKPDVDNPLDLAWDNSGDLLIGNGGTTVGGDFGDLACVPVGAIASGANTATTTSPDVDDPAGLAYDSRNGTVALANINAGAPEQLAEFTLSGDYTPAPPAADVAASGLEAESVVGISTLPAGSFAVSLTNGTEVDPAHGSGLSKIAIKNASGAETDIFDNAAPYAIDEPKSIAWDAQNSQIAIANFSSFHKLLSFYTIGGTQVKTIVTGLRNYKVAASPSGYIAVAGNTSTGYPQVFVYDNTAARNAPVVGGQSLGPIPLNAIDNATDCNNGVGYVYGDSPIVNALTWLSDTKLLVGVQAYSSGTSISTNGFYIYDISASATPAGVDDNSCNAFGLAPKETGFVHVNNKPLAAAFKP